MLLQILDVVLLPTAVVVIGILAIVAYRRPRKRTGNVIDMNDMPH